MKKFFWLLLFSFSLNSWLGAQVPPQAFNYQAVARDSSGNEIANRSIGLKIGIVRDSANGGLVYSETFNTTTNQFGLFSVGIGSGVPVIGHFPSINWATTRMWLKVEADVTGGGNYVLMGITELLSVPYALYAASSGYSHHQNVTTSVSALGDTVFIGNTFVIMPGASAANVCRMDFEDVLPYTVGYPHAGDAAYNTALYGLPKFIQKNYIELDKIDSISKFRSGAGHSYSDDYEACRSMKHYFRPSGSVDWSAIKIFSPVSGTISNSFSEPIGGNQVWIVPFGMPAFNVTIFHVNLTTPLNVGDTVWSGQQIGLHTGPQTGSDIAVQVMDVNNTMRRVSFFDVMTDKLFECFRTKGITSRQQMIIPKADRDADPLLPCNGNQFFYQGTLPNWVPLQH